jgi:hypothetical protein
VNFTVIDAEQRSPEWYLARCGRLTGSKADILLAKGKKGEESIQRRDLRLQIACERITGVPDEEGFFGKDMQRGLEMEPLAFAAYEVATGEMCRKTGFLQHNTLMAGCSLDADIGNFSGIVEFKCPKTYTHLMYLREPQTLLAEYLAQVRHNLWISGATFCDLVSFDNRLPARLQLLRLRVECYNAGIPDYEMLAVQFLNEVENEVAKIEGMTHARI